MKTNSLPSSFVSLAERVRESKISTIDPYMLEESLPIAPQRSQECDSPSKSSALVFGSTFLTVFLAEFGDKTQLSTLLMSAESRSPWIVFLGSAAALIATSLLGVLLGRWIATRSSPQTVQKLAGVSMLLISMMLLWDVIGF